MTVDDSRVLFAHLTSCKPHELASCTIVHSVFCAAGCSATAMAMHVRLYILQNKQGEACMAFLPGCLTAQESACHVVTASRQYVLTDIFQQMAPSRALGSLPKCADANNCTLTTTPRTAHCRRAGHPFQNGDPPLNFPSVLKCGPIITVGRVVSALAAAARDAALHEAAVVEEEQQHSCF
jgi:hypothetical protein